MTANNHKNGGGAVEECAQEGSLLQITFFPHSHLDFFFYYFIFAFLKEFVLGMLVNWPNVVAHVQGFQLQTYLLVD